MLDFFFDYFESLVFCIIEPLDLAQANLSGMKRGHYICKIRS